MVREFKGWHMAAIMVAFFGVIIAVNITMAVFANQSWTGLIVKNGYVASQDFNDKLAEADAQHRLGWRSEIAYAGERLEIALSDANGAPVRLERLGALVGRPAFEREDRSVELSYLGGGRYVGDLDLAEGIWQLRLEGVAGATPYRREARIFIGADGIGKLQ